MPNLFEYQAESYPSWWNWHYAQDYSETNLNHMKADGASQVVLVPTVWMDTLTSSEVKRDPNRTESDANIRDAVADAKERGMDVIFKLHLDTQNTDWRALMNPADKDAFFASYKQQVLHYAQLAQEGGAKAFAIGTELESLSTAEYADEWRDIIAAVRQVFTGDLTYAATPPEAFHISFWDALDYIGINPYVSLVPPGTTNATYQQMVDGWTKPSTVDWVRQWVGDKPVIEAIKDFSASVGKPVIFTETGYRSMDGNAGEPWSTNPNGAIDEMEQANLFRAFFKVLGDFKGDWLGGYWLWNWDAGPDAANPAADNGYYTQGKQSDAVITQWMTNPVSVEGRTLVGTTGDETLSGNFNNDRLSGNSGADTLIGGAGNDVMTGGVGGNLFSYTAGGGADRVVDFSATQGDKIQIGVAGVTNFSQLSVTQVNGGYQVGFADGGSITINTTDTISADWFTFTDNTSGGPSTRPSAGNDSITGTTRNDTIDALGGDDYVDGLAGADLVYGGEGNDTLMGNAGGDRLYGGNGDDILDAGLGNDAVYGGAGMDTLSGGDGNDRLFGEAGDDQILDAAGNNVINGGDGNDLIYTGTGNDNINGGLGDDSIQAKDGNDTLQGGEGHDLVEGWFGNDVLRGGAGRDVLVGGGDNDMMYGGVGADRFVFGDFHGDDVIWDFKTGLVDGEYEMLIIQGNINGTGVGGNVQTILDRATQVGSDTMIDLGDGNSLLLKNVLKANLKADHFWFW